jgi:hypothetical protein
MRIELDGARKVDFFQDLYQEARAASESLYENMERYREQYKGSNEYDNSHEQARLVRNITYELVESQVTSYIPTPSVSPEVWSERNERNAKSIETMLKNKRNELPFEKLNDIDERYNPIYGGSVWLVEWDESILTHNTVGDVKVTCLAPSRFTGQPNIFDVADMEYCFVEFTTTKEDIERRYGVTPTVADDAENEESADDKTATLYVCYYKDDEDKVCEYVWSGDTELLDIEDYYARKRYVCKVCGRRKEICVCEDGEGEYELLNEEYEELDHDIILSDGSTIPAMSEKIEDGRVVTETAKQTLLEDDGTPAMEELNGAFVPITFDVQIPVTEPTKLPYFRPSSLPIVIRKNTSQEDSLFGQSDCEFIRPQQQAINKLESRILEKIVRGGVMPLVPEDFDGELDDTICENVRRVSANTKPLYGVVDMQTNIGQDVAAAERLYDQAKRILGITDSFQGQYDGSAQSGKAKQLQIQQAAGRLDSKRRMKNAAYAEIDKVIFEYYLAYADEPRPASYRDAYGRVQNSTFNRYDFIERDESGAYYYNAEYLFACDASIDYESARELIWEKNLQNLTSGTLGNPQDPTTLLRYWLCQERAHYPGAHENVEYMREQIAQMQQMQQLQAQNEQLARQNAAQGEELKNHESYESYLMQMMGGNG